MLNTEYISEAIHPRMIGFVCPCAWKLISGDSYRHVVFFSCGIFLDWCHIKEKRALNLFFVIPWNKSSKKYLGKGYGVRRLHTFLIVRSQIDQESVKISIHFNNSVFLNERDTLYRFIKYKEKYGTSQKANSSLLSKHSSTVFWILLEISISFIHQNY